MQKTFIDARFLSDMQVEAYGVTYLFRIENLSKGINKFMTLMRYLEYIIFRQKI